MGGQRELFLASLRFNLTEWLSLDRMRKFLLSLSLSFSQNSATLALRAILGIFIYSRDGERDGKV